MKRPLRTEYKPKTGHECIDVSEYRAASLGCSFDFLPGAHRVFRARYFPQTTGPTPRISRSAASAAAVLGLRIVAPARG